MNNIFKRELGVQWIMSPNKKIKSVKVKSDTGLPKEYSLLPDEFFFALDEGEEIPKNYFVGADTPENAVVGETIWYDTLNNAVMIYINMATGPQWVETDSHLKYVANFHTGEILGKILKKAPQDIVSSEDEIVIPPVSLDDYLNEN